jgi:hypothetical protein
MKEKELERLPWDEPDVTATRERADAKAIDQLYGGEPVIVDDFSNGAESVIDDLDVFAQGRLAEIVEQIETLQERDLPFYEKREKIGELCKQYHAIENFLLAFQDEISGYQVTLDFWRVKDLRLKLKQNGGCK